jgi:fucose permease
MKYLLALFLLASCTTPQIVSPLDKDGNQIHSVLKEPFFGSPNQASEWSFWYLILVAVVLVYAWKEFKSIKFPKSKNDK